MSVPPSTIWLQSHSYSSCEPSTQWIADGLVISAVFSTHLSRCLLVVSETGELVCFITPISDFLYNHAQRLYRLRKAKLMDAKSESSGDGNSNSLIINLRGRPVSYIDSMKSPFDSNHF